MDEIAGFPVIGTPCFWDAGTVIGWMLLSHLSLVLCCLNLEVVVRFLCAGNPVADDAFLDGREGDRGDADSSRSLTSAMRLKGTGIALFRRFGAFLEPLLSSSSEDKST